MGDGTKIEWTDATWNPVHGCSVVSPGCENCYAAAFSQRFGHTKKPWTAPNAAENVQLHPERLDQPLRWKRPRRIFVNSMSDLFHEQVPDAFIRDVCYRMALSPQHTFQVLTKRPQRMLDFLMGPGQSGVCEIDRVNDPLIRWGIDKPLPNVWLGVSVEDQRRADERIPLLLKTPAAVRFLSCEPLLEAVDLRRWLTGNPRIDWVIVGGES